ncbi:hypothetical protein PF007_g27545 [Phytophthora fragariae]|uniref:Retrotransposon gag domain-containing protein n=1 Tax=Phytophthora fragariae TaxID=53985 RepID=A0A6A3Q4P4_9STRA|nr:hypothetical protein PF007_g27545 [Phytophthora fragariae]
MNPPDMDGGDPDDDDDIGVELTEQGEEYAEESVGNSNGLEGIVRSLQPGGKPNLKLINVGLFSGRIEPREFDSKVRTWWAEFNSQLLGAQLRDNHRWNEIIKCSFLQASLTGDAAKWFNRLWSKSPHMTLKSAGQRLIRQYSTKIDEEEIRDRIKACTKQPSESYEMYSQKLQNMADSLPGGVQKRTNGKAALSAFVRTACPSRTEQLEYWVLTQKGQNKPAHRLDSLVELLGQLDKTDGVEVSLPTEFAEAPQKRFKGPTGGAYAATAATATVVDRKRKGKHGEARQPSKYGPFAPPPWVNENTQCFKCKGRGHIGRDPTCPKYKATTPLGNAVMKATTEDA